MFNLTPIEFINGYYFKREDYFKFENVCGSKVRSALFLCENEKIGLVTAGSRKSPQIQIISEIAKFKNLPFVAFTPSGYLTKELEYAKNNGAIINQVEYGYNNNIIKKAKDFSIKNNFKYIPFGMECIEAINQNIDQVQNIPKEVNNIIAPVGSGISVIGILLGLKKYNINKKVIGICVGANPLKRLNKYLYPFWENDLKLIYSELDYHKEEKNNFFCGTEFDNIYEAKCLKYLNKGDLFWIVGKGIR